MPIVKRAALCSADSPTVASMTPKTVIERALTTFPFPANAAIAVSPSTMSAKYSADQNSFATVDKTGAKIMRSIAPMVPPANEQIAAVVSAFPACPARAIG